ncbi:GerAB/ArcD/ProY family transporter [Domibacillus robiginosus]|uniref:GerAB/ArcD/ProY family transporter n=1 Tax=Domibacillus robiginosus TaxID=1071054 RepID=UPI00067CAE05|nr:GerAB/ArcD/ProY family transporter [Domibacillus robiginosus]
MENAKISPRQLFVLIILFQLGSSLLIPVGLTAKQDAWLAVLGGMVGGLLLFLLYYKVGSYYPGLVPTEYMAKIWGPFFGKIFAFLYVLYLFYLAARVLRDYGEMLVIFAYPETPLFIVNLLWMVLVVYTVRKGIETLARTGEILFVVVSILALTSLLLLVLNGSIDTKNLQPVLEEGPVTLIKAIGESVFFPFGEIVVFTMIYPYLNQLKKAKRVGLYALLFSGFVLSVTMAVNLSVLGFSLLSRSNFPLLSTIQTINVAEFLERLDVFFMIGVVIGGFFKITIFFYVAVMGATSLFKVKESSHLVFPLGFITLFLSVGIASNFSEHIQEGLDIVPLYLHLPFQVIFPLLLLVSVVLKNRKKQKKQLAMK